MSFLNQQLGSNITYDIKAIENLLSETAKKDGSQFINKAENFLKIITKAPQILTLEEEKMRIAADIIRLSGKVKNDVERRAIVFFLSSRLDIETTDFS